MASERDPKTAADIHLTHTEVVLVEVTSLVKVGLFRLPLSLEQVAQDRDPLTEALEQELARESREAPGANASSFEPQKPLEC